MSDKTTGGGAWGPCQSPLPPLQFPNQKRSKHFSYGCSEFIRTKSFKISTVYVTIFGQYLSAFHFF